MRFPDEKLTIIVLANSWNTREFKLARGLAAFYFPEFAVPSAPSIADAEPKTTALIRKFLLQLTGGSFDKESLTPAFAAELTTERVNGYASLWNSLTLPVAIIHSEELVERRNENGQRTYHYLFNDIPKTLSLKVKLTNDDKIAAFELVEVN